MSEITVFAARKIITMDPGRPVASALAVRDGRILSVGTIDSMRRLRRYEHQIDDTFADKVVLPGFIDPHTHLSRSGAYMFLNYVGPIPSPGPTASIPRCRRVMRSWCALARCTLRCATTPSRCSRGDSIRRSRAGICIAMSSTESAPRVRSRFSPTSDSLAPSSLSTIRSGNAGSLTTACWMRHSDSKSRAPNSMSAVVVTPARCASSAMRW